MPSLKLKKAASFLLPVSHAAYHRLVTGALHLPAPFVQGPQCFLIADLSLGVFACLVP